MDPNKNWHYALFWAVVMVVLFFAVLGVRYTIDWFRYFR